MTMLQPVTIAERGIDLLPDVGECRARAGVRPRHAAITKSCEQHGHHGDEERGDDMSVAGIAEHAKDGHRRNRLNHDDPV